MTNFSAFARTCGSLLAGRKSQSESTVLNVAISDRSEADLARSGQTSAAILHNTFSGLYYA